MSQTDAGKLTRIVSISAMLGGNAEKVLRQLLKSTGSSRNGWAVTAVLEPELRWVLEAHNRCTNEKWEFHVRLADRTGQLHLEDDPYREGWSNKPVKNGIGSLFTLRIGKNLDHRLAHIADTLVACWVVRGFNSLDSEGKLIPKPYGNDPIENNSHKRRSRQRPARGRRDRFAFGGRMADCLQ